MRQRWTQADIRGASLWFVASLTAGGQVYRWAEKPLSINSDTGSLSISPGLQGARVSQSAPWMGREPEQRKATVELSPARGINPAELLRGRYMLDGSPLEIALWREGDPWEDRQIRMNGWVTSYEWGGSKEPLSIYAEESALQDRALIPEPGALVSPATWPYAAPSMLGIQYPTILGAPGSNGVPASPAMFVACSTIGGSEDLLLVAGHPVSATSVSITASDGTGPEVFAITTRTDGLGRQVSVVDISAAALITKDATLSYRVAWDQGGAGMLAVSGTSPALGAGSILEAVLARSTLPVDRGSLSSARDPLNAYQLGGFIQQPLSPLEWVTRIVLPLLPVSILTGPSGWRVLPILLSPKLSDCICTLKVGTQVVRLERARRVGFDEVANEFELAYALNIDTNAQTASALLSGAGWDGVSHTDLSSQLSRNTYGPRIWTGQTIAIYHQSTAYKTLRWQSIAYAFTRILLRYSCIQTYSFLCPGNMVWLVDDVLCLDRPAWVQVVDLTSDGRVEIELVCWETPDAIATG